MSISRLNLIDIPPPKIARTCAIVVMFHPDSGFCQRLQKIWDQFPTTVVVDNTPGGALTGVLPDSVHVLRNEKNVGVATALNQGIAFAASKQCSWAASFDQDTELSPGYLEAVVAIVQGNGAEPVLVGANYINSGSDHVAHKPPAGAIDAWPRLTLITSGTFMPVQFVISIGGFRDDYFIDSVDHEFCLRARRHGARVLMTTLPYMHHQMGTAEARLGMRLSLQHAPIRRYYIARNALATVHANAWKHPIWSLRQLGRLVGEAIAIIALEQQRAPKLRAFVKGLWHGLIGRSGAHE